MGGDVALDVHNDPVIELLAVHRQGDGIALGDAHLGELLVALHAGDGEGELPGDLLSIAAPCDLVCELGYIILARRQLNRHAGITSLCPV